MPTPRHKVSHSADPPPERYVIVERPLISSSFPRFSTLSLPPFSFRSPIHPVRPSPPICCLSASIAFPPFSDPFQFCLLLSRASYMQYLIFSSRSSLSRSSGLYLIPGHTPTHLHNSLLVFHLIHLSN